MPEYASNIDKIDVHYVASLARISLTEQETQVLQTQLENILNYINQLKKIDISNVELIEDNTLISNHIRKDEIKPTLDPELVFNNAPLMSHNNEFLVPKIVE